MKAKKSLTSIILTALLAACALSSTSCYSWYEDKIDMDKQTSKSNLEDLFYLETPVTSLDAPKQLLVSKGVYSGTVKLHWDEVPYATSYRIERAEMEPDLDGKTYQLPDEGDFEVINKYVYSTNFSDLILASPSESNKEYQKHYFYRVSAENIKMGLESSDFTEVSTQNSGWLLSPPAQIDAAKGENQEYIEVRWSPVDMASKYLIFRSEKSTGLGMEQLDSVTGNITSYNNYLTENEKGLEFYYKVCAVLESGSQSAFTGLAMGYSAKAGAPQAPSDITVTNGLAQSLESLSITWTPPQNTTGVITYNIYRTTSEDSIYTLICSNCSGTSFADTSAKKTGIKYYYYIQTVEKDTSTDEKLKSPFSKTGPGTPDEAVGWLLSPPQNCEVAEHSDATKVVLRWGPSVGSEDVDYLYYIYSCDTLDGNFERIDGPLGASQLELANDGYYERTLARKPFYKISAVNSANTNLESEKSQAIAPCPKAPRSVVATKTSSLGGIANYTANTNGVYPVKISWSAPANETPYGYHIYRSTKPDSSFRKITDSPVTDSLSFIDENETARPGTMYYYKVVSLNVLMQGKNSNAQTADSRGYGALTRDQWFREYNKTVKKSQAKLTLMHKGGTSALGSESATGDISGKLEYNASMAGLGARITMHYTNYAEFYVNNNPSLGVYFLLDGDTNTTANMSANGSMDGTNTASQSGMYPGYAKYDNLEIKGGGAGGGGYIVCTKDKNGNIILGEGNVDWTIGEE